MMNEPNVTGMPDLYDRQIGSLVGIPDVLFTKKSVVQDVTPIVGDEQLFTVQTYRQPEIGDLIFVTCSNKSGTIRLVLPSKVAKTIARQREALTARGRSKKAKAAAEDRKSRGILPGFMKAARA